MWVIVLVFVKFGGVISYIGFGFVEGGFDICWMIFQEIIFIGIYIYIVEDFCEMVKVMFDGWFGVFDWIDSWLLFDGLKVFQDLYVGVVVVFKILFILDI